MKTLLIVPAACAALLFAPATAGTPQWFAGCWESPDQSAKEVWVAEPDGALMGFGVALDQGKVKFYELLKIEVNEGGDLSYTAYPIGQAPASFHESERSDTSIVFTNPDHDYPQKIAYRREGNMLYASTAALDGRNEHTFTKQACQ